MKRTKLFVAALALSALMSSTAYAGEWIPDTAGWRYQNDDGSFAANAAIDGYYVANDGLRVAPVALSEKDVKKKLFDMHNWVVGDVWNSGLCDIGEYVAKGTNTIGEDMDISETVALLDAAMLKLNEYDHFINGLPADVYGSKIENWNTLKTEAIRLHAQVKAETPRAKDKSYKFDYKVLSDCVFKF